jgi:hypothetical protein
MGPKTNAYKILVVKPEGKRPLEDQGIGGWIILKWNMDWFGLAQDKDQCRALVNTVMNLQVP